MHNLCLLMHSSRLIMHSRHNLAYSATHYCHKGTCKISDSLLDFEKNKTKYTMDPGIYFQMKNNKKELD